MEKEIVLDIKNFSIHDGPEINFLRNVKSR
jgi:hypothetical protein